MKNQLRLLTIICLVALCSIAAYGQLTFDTLSGGDVAVPNGYGGLNWDNFNSLTASGSAFQNGVVSSPNIIYNVGGNPGTISSSSNPFELISGYASAGSSGPLDLRVDGYYLGVDVITGDLLIDNSMPYFFSASSPVVIDTLVFQATNLTTFDTSGPNAEFSLDDLTITAVSVPEPTTLALFGAGFAALAGTIRRRRRAADR